MSSLALIPVVPLWCKFGKGMTQAAGLRAQAQHWGREHGGARVDKLATS